MAQCIKYGWKAIYWLSIKISLSVESKAWQGIEGE